MKQHPSVQQYIDNDFNVENSPYAHCSNFYDWFCRDSSLPNKKAKLDTKLLKLSTSPKLDTSKLYCYYKNSCPLNGSLYDQIFLANLDTGDVEYCITPNDPHSNNYPTVYIPSNDTELMFNTWSELLNYFEVKKKVG